MEKTKTSKKGLNILLTGGIALVFIIVLTAIRSYQMLNITDYSTGFFTDSSNPTVLAFYVLAVLFPIVTLVLAKFTDKSSARDVYTPRRDIIRGCASLLFAVAIVRDISAKISDITTGADEMGYSSVAYIKAEGKYQAIAAIVFALLSVVLFLINAVTDFTGSGKAAKLKILHLFPSLWLFTKLVGYFSVTASYIKEPQFLLLIFATAFLMLFLFEDARYECGVGGKSSKTAFRVSGIVAAGYITALIIPDLITGITVEGYTGVVNAEFAQWHSASLVIVVSFLTGRITAPNYHERKKMKLDAADEEKAAENIVETVAFEKNGDIENIPSVKAVPVGIEEEFSDTAPMEVEAEPVVGTTDSTEA